jgi:hypothetical protein
MKPTTHFSFAPGLLAATVLALGAGCATKYEVKVTSICRPNPATHEIASYDIRAKAPVPEEDSLRYKEAAKQIKTALSSKGLYEAPSPAAADMVVEIEYGMAPPKVKYEPCNRPIIARPKDLPDGRATMDPTKEVVGYEDFVYPVVTREKHLSVCGRENKQPGEGRPPAEIWRVEVSISDESHDLRGYLPILASAAMDEIGRNSDGTATTTLKENDESIRFIKKGM